MNDVSKSFRVKISVCTYGEEENNQIRRNECQEDTQIPPAVLEFVAKGLVEFISDLECTVLADIGGIVEEIAWSSVREEVGHVRSTVLTRWSIELIVFH